MTTPHNGENEPPNPSYPLPAPPEQSGHQAPPPGYAPYGYYPSHHPIKQTETMAIVSLVLSVLGFATCGVSALVGAIMGRIALTKIRANPDVLEGEGLAKSGMIVGWVLFGMHVVGVLAYIGFIIFAISMGASEGWN